MPGNQAVIRECLENPLRNEPRGMGVYLVDSINIKCRFFKQTSSARAHADTADDNGAGKKSTRLLSLRPTSWAHAHRSLMCALPLSGSGQNRRDTTRKKGTHGYHRDNPRSDGAAKTRRMFKHPRNAHRVCQSARETTVTLKKSQCGKKGCKPNGD